MIVRPYYMNTLRKYRDVPLVKVLAGIRRCGKSTILEMLKADLINGGIAADHVIHMRYTSEEFDAGMTDRDMYRGIRQRMNAPGRYYLLLDEVQEVEGWERAINSLMEDTDADIYVTGSNSRLMSGEISTYLTGRYPYLRCHLANIWTLKRRAGAQRGRRCRSTYAWADSR